MQTHRCCAQVLVATFLASLGAAGSFASPPHKSIGAIAPRAVMADVPVAGKALKQETKPGRQMLTPAAGNSLRGNVAPPDLIPVAFFASPAQVGLPAGFSGVECCYPPGFSTACQFTITVDSSGQIAESNEANNSAQSTCVSPAG